MNNTSEPEPVAIVGMACRFPCAGDPEKYWRLLKGAHSAIREVPPDRWDIDEYYDPDPSVPGKMNTRWGGFLDQVDQFDHQFFKMSPREAAQTDPQQRLLLEVAWEALEDAGLPPSKLAGSKTGVFVGVMTSDYNFITLTHPNVIDVYTGTGGVYCIIANRLSYLLDFRGPSMAIDTACSSSLVAAHYACQSLRSGESTAALVGGVNLIISPWGTIYFTKAGLMAPDGRCKTFDANANGFVRGEGAGIVVLKLLSQAVADGDKIYAVISGSAVNQDGRTNGLTSPSRWSQMAVLSEAYKQAGVQPSEIQYVEAHGTGTFIGDPIEAEALGSVIGQGRAQVNPCAVGSVKTNIGHLEGAAGVAGLIKVALMIKHRQIPPSLNFREPSRNIAFDNLRLRVQTELSEWPDPSMRLTAGVSSFGFGGTNVHVVVQEAPVSTENESHGERSFSGGAFLLPISARTPESLKSLASNYKNLLLNAASSNDSVAGNICSAASLNRDHHEHRLAVVGSDCASLANRLEAVLQSAVTAPAGKKGRGRKPKLAWIFCGQGAQWWAMGRELLEQQSTVRSVLKNCDDLFFGYAGWSLIEEFNRNESDSRIHQTEVAQPALFALQISLAALWRSWGIAPDMVVGHSIGEVAAAYVAGRLSLEDAVKVVFHRSRLMQRATGKGRMVSVELASPQLEPLLESYDGRISIAAINGPSTTVISGDTSDVENFTRKLAELNVACQPLHVNYAFHSSHMESIAGELYEALKDIKPLHSSAPLLSTLTGKAAADLDFDAHYWALQMREPVRFADAMDELAKTGYKMFLEVGPHPVLAPAIAQCLRDKNEAPIILSSLRRHQPETETILTALAAFYVQGLAIDWPALYGTRMPYVDLPKYAWHKGRCWLEPEGPYFKSPSRSTTATGIRSHPLLGQHVEMANPAGTHCWELSFDPNDFAYFSDHKIQGEIVLPGTAYIEMAFAACAEVSGHNPSLANIRFDRALFLDGDPLTIQIIFSASKDGLFDFFIYSRNAYSQKTDEPWSLHASGLLQASINQPTDPPIFYDHIASIQERCGEKISADSFYKDLQQAGNEYGYAFQGVGQIWKGENEILALVNLPTEMEAGNYHAHPALLDACGQVMALGARSGAGAFMPVRIGEIRLYRDLPNQVWSYVRLRPSTPNRALNSAGDIRVLDREGNLLVEFLDVEFHYLNSAVEQAESANQFIYEEQWQIKDFSTQQRASTNDGGWVILADKGGVGDSLASLLKEQGESPVVIYAGPDFVTLAEDRFELPLGDYQQLAELINRIEKSGRSCSSIINLWNVDESVSDEMNSGSLKEVVLSSCANVLGITRSLSSLRWKQTPKLWVVTRGAQSITGDGNVDPSQTILWGLGRSIAQECSSHWGGLIDLDPSASSKESSAAMLQRAIRGDYEEDRMAFRKREFYVARIARHQESKLEHESMTFGPDASYLITGGLGGLGLQVARWMAQQGARRIVLLSRSKFPARASWENLDENARERSQVDAIRQIEALGAAVYLHSVDVSNERELQDFIAQFNLEEMPPIRGIIHAAGVSNLVPILEMDKGALDAVFQPKVEGAWNLHRIFKNADLDFFLLFSSASTLIDSPGLGHYAAANAFLDGLAARRRADGLVAQSIDWGPWAEVGMAAREFQKQGKSELGAMKSISPEQGLELLDRVIVGDATRVATMIIDWPKFQASYKKLFESPYFDFFRSNTIAAVRSNGRNGKRDSILPSLLSLERQDRSALLESYLSKEVCKALRLPVQKLDEEQPLNMLGLDSLNAIELKNVIETEIKVAFPLVKLLQGPTISQLAAEILKALDQSEETQSPHNNTTLENIDHLSDAEVDSMLKDLLSEGAGQ